MNEPESPNDWQAAVDAADFLILLDDAVRFGLLTGGPTANVTRCLDILDRGAERGVFPSLGERRRARIAHWLRCEREAIGLSQGDVARLMRGSQPWVSMVERGCITISDDAVTQIRHALGAARRRHR